MTRYMVANEELGIFLGIFENVAFFSTQNVVAVDRAVTFDDEVSAIQFIHRVEEYDERFKGLKVLPVDCHDRYASVVEIIKAGHGSYAREMFEMMPAVTDTLH
ncbi:MAG: hypothetical protein WCY93_11260 [Anaerolineaceae bacterium]